MSESESPARSADSAAFSDSFPRSFIARSPSPADSPKCALVSFGRKSEFALQSAAAQRQRECELEAKVQRLTRRLEEANAARRQLEAENRRLEGRARIVEKEYRRMHDAGERTSGRSLLKALDAVSSPVADWPASPSEIAAPAPLSAVGARIDALASLFGGGQSAAEGDVAAPVKALVDEYKAAIDAAAEAMAEQNELVARLLNEIADLRLEKLYADDSSAKASNASLEAAIESGFGCEANARRSSVGAAQNVQTVLCQSENLTEVAQKVKELYLCLQRRCDQIRFLGQLLKSWANAAESLLSDDSETAPKAIFRCSVGDEKLEQLAAHYQKRLRRLAAAAKSRAARAEANGRADILRRIAPALGGEATRAAAEIEAAAARSPLAAVEVVEQFVARLLRSESSLGENRRASNDKSPIFAPFRAVASLSNSVKSPKSEILAKTETAINERK